VITGTAGESKVSLRVQTIMVAAKRTCTAAARLRGPLATTAAEVAA